ncbi:MAG: type II toxin-antitoxin system HicB family antitoxin [Candidatus Marinimicrobia bacterium]|nr:type II toxin-antitoxin system HicB family antitoxin [Candidatus Neomarinimicrobiota bacterium]
MDKNLEYFKSLPYQIKTAPVTDSDGTHYWLAEISELRGCKTEGETETEAITNLQELFTEYIETMLEASIDISEPEPLPEIVGQITWIQINPPVMKLKNLPQEQTLETSGVYEKTNQNQLTVQPTP